MAHKTFMDKVRYWDNRVAKWIMRHFYLLFFQIVLVIIFLFWFVQSIGIIDLSIEATRSKSLTERLLCSQSVMLSVIVFLMLLNSFWLLYMFSGVQRLRSLLRDMNYNIGRLRQRNRNQPS